MTGTIRSDSSVIQGEFFTDGSKFIFRLEGTPLSGVGDNPSAAFADLMRLEAQTTPLSALIKERARDQEGERVRSTIIRTTMIGLVVFAVLAGALVGTAGLLPRVVADVGGVTLMRLANAVDTMTPEQEAELARVGKRLNTLLGHPDGVAADCGKQPIAGRP